MLKHWCWRCYMILKHGGGCHKLTWVMRRKSNLQFIRSLPSLIGYFNDAYIVDSDRVIGFEHYPAMHSWTSECPTLKTLSETPILMVLTSTTWNFLILRIKVGCSNQASFFSIFSIALNGNFPLIQSWHSLTGKRQINQSLSIDETFLLSGFFFAVGNF